MEQETQLRVLHLADLHLGIRCHFLQDKQADRATDFSSAFRRAIDFALDPDNRIDLVLIAGDLFDSHRPRQDALKEVSQAFRKLEQRNLPAALVPGEHDSLAYPDSVYRTEKLPWVHLFDDKAIGEPWTVLVRDLPVHLYGMGYQQSSASPLDSFRASGGDGLHIAMLHGIVTDTPERFPARYLPMTQDCLKKTGMDYIALGHQHNFLHLKDGACPVVYPGTLEGSDFTETGERFLVTAGFAGGKVHVQRTPFQSRILKEITLETASTPVFSDEDLIRVIRKHASPDDIVTIRIKGEVEFVPRLAGIESVMENDFYHLTLLDEASISGSRLVQGLKQEKTVRGIFARRMQERILAAREQDRTVLEMAMKDALSGLLSREDPDADHSGQV